MKSLISVLFLIVFSLTAFAQNSLQEKIKVISSSWSYSQGFQTSISTSVMDSQQRDQANESIKNSDYRPSKENIRIEFENTGVKNIKSVEYIFSVVNSDTDKLLFRYKLKDSLDLSPNKRIEISHTFRIENSSLRKLYQNRKSTVTIKKLVFSDKTSEKF